MDSQPKTKTPGSGKSSLTATGFGSTQNFEFGSVETRTLDQFDLTSGANTVEQETGEMDASDTSSGHQRFRTEAPQNPSKGVFHSPPENMPIPVPVDVEPAKTDSNDPFLLTKPGNRALEPDAPDPVKEDPDKVWYVRHPQKGETGPVKGKVIQQMLKNAEIDSTCVVWREDWEDWEKAHLIFRELPGPDDGEVSGDIGSASQSTFGSLNPNGLWSIVSRQRKLILIVTGVIACVATIVGLIYVLIRIISN